MKQTKIIIEINQASVINVYSNTPVAYVIVDHDTFETGNDPVYGPFAANILSEPLHQQFSDEDRNSHQVKKELIALNF